MNYKSAVSQLFEKKTRKYKKKVNVFDFPKGWVHLRKDGIIHDNRSSEEIIHYETMNFNKNIYDGFKEISERFLNYKKNELALDGYTEDEIEYYIYNISNMFNNDDYESDDEINKDIYFSSDEEYSDDNY